MIEFDRTPVWHASISVVGIAVADWTTEHHLHAHLLAGKLVAGRGDPNHRDVEGGNIALHIRRKISDAEKSIIGPAQIRPGVPSE